MHVKLLNLILSMTYIKTLFNLNYITKCLHDNISTNTINILNYKKGTLILTNHINCVETMDEFKSNDIKKSFELLITDVLIVNKCLITNKPLNQIYFPSYNKSIYTSDFMANLFSSSTTILNDICDTVNYCGVRNKLNIIYSYKSTNKILELLNNNEIVIIMFVSPKLIKEEKIKHFVSKTNCDIITLKIKRNNKYNYYVENKDIIYENIDNIKNILFNPSGN